MRKLFGLLALTGALAITGCDDHKDKSVDAEPPAPQFEPMTPPAKANTPAAAPAPAPAAAAPAPAPKSIPVAPEPKASAPVTAAPAAGSTYVVQKGDTIYSIARKTYGDTKKVKAIIDLNHLADPNKLTVGQKLQLP